MKIEKIGYFLSVAKHLNFTKAAQECHIAQPAISRQMSSLEEELGFALFDRSSRKVRLDGKVDINNRKAYRQV